VLFDWLFGCYCLFFSTMVKNNSFSNLRFSVSVSTCRSQAAADWTQFLRLRNDLYCVEWGVKLYSLTHSLDPVFRRCPASKTWLAASCRTLPPLPAPSPTSSARWRQVPRRSLEVLRPRPAWRRQVAEWWTTRIIARYCWSLMTSTTTGKLISQCEQ